MTMEIYQILVRLEEKSDMEKATAIRDLILKELVLDEYDRWRDTEHFAAAGACANMVVKLMGIPTTSRNAELNAQVSESKTI